MRLYVNGVEVASRAQTGPIQTSTGALTIGGDALYGQYFAGRIDEVRIYRSALTPAQMQADMATAIGGGSPPETQPPTAPTNLTATVTSSSQINLSWTASTDNVGVTGYRVERCQGSGCSTFLQVATPTGTTYNDTGLTANTSYSYRVRATDAADNLGPYSTTASATTQATVSGLVAAYSFDEGAGTSVADASGTGNTGNVSNTTWTTAGKYGGALSFNGTNALVTVADAASLDLTTGMTLEAWVNPSNVSRAWREVIYKGTNNYYLEATSNQNPAAPAGGGTIGGSNVRTVGTSVLPLNTWTHLAVTYDGARLRLYVNGVERSNRARTGNILTSTNPLRLGSNGSGQYFQGLIDEVRIYSVARTAAQIQADLSTPITSSPLVQLPAASGLRGSVELYQRGPNPGVASTIAFVLPERATVSLDIFDVQGKRVCSLARGAFEAGEHTVMWNGRDDAGGTVANGTYFCRLQVGQTSLVRKLALVR
jgi:chitodextrinase